MLLITLFFHSQMLWLFSQQSAFFSKTILGETFPESFLWPPRACGFSLPYGTYYFTGYSWPCTFLYPQLEGHLLHNRNPMSKEMCMIILYLAHYRGQSSAQCNNIRTLFSCFQGYLHLCNSINIVSPRKLYISEKMWLEYIYIYITVYIYFMHTYTHIHTC